MYLSRFLAAFFKTAKKPALYFLVLLLFLTSLGASASVRKQSQDGKAVYQLIERMLPGYATQFILEKIPSVNGKDVFEVSFEGNKIALRGNNPIALASAFHWYLKYQVDAHLSWNGDRIKVPKSLPVPEATVRKLIDPKQRIYLNYCTLNYSASWWTWERWQREIDYMAMNGINMPLSVVGLEGVWYHTLLQFGFSDLEAREFLVGPAYFAWQWMTNIQSFAGPLPKSWIDSHIELGQKIMDRQLELGMQPIQQGFTGYVPRKLKQKYPNANILLEQDWYGFKGTAQLDPLDPMFKTFGDVFLKTQKSLFGAHGVYAADPFHEGTPPEQGKEYLNKVGKAIFKLLTEFDPNASWAMQSWSIRKDIATMVPKDRLLVLDLGGWKWPKIANAWGYDFVVGNLHNFGGRTNLHGDMQLLASNQYQQAKRQAPNATGNGLFMESVGQNPLYYDLAFEMTFHQHAINLDEWVKRYTKRRYGQNTPKTDKAMQLLIQHPYSTGTNGVENSSIIAARPAVDVKKSGPNAGFDIPYNPQKLIESLTLLHSQAKLLGDSDPYRFDLVDIQRQVLSNLGQRIHKEAAKAFKVKDRKAFSLHSSRFLELLLDVDTLLKSRSEMSFDKWVADARRWGGNEEEKDLYELNASMLVTHWGGDGDAVIFDYSWHEWSGLIKGYYHPRWQKFYAMLDTHLQAGTDYDEASLPLNLGREALRANAFYNQLTEWEMQWITSRKDIDPVARGDEVKLVASLLKKYTPLFHSYYRSSISPGSPRKLGSTNL